MKNVKYQTSKLYSFHLYLEELAHCNGAREQVEGKPRRIYPVLGRNPQNEFQVESA